MEVSGTDERRKAYSLFPPSQSSPSPFFPPPSHYQQQLYSNPIITVTATIIIIYWVCFSSILTSENIFQSVVCFHSRLWGRTVPIL